MVEGGGSPPLLCSCDIPPVILCPTLRPQHKKDMENPCCWPTCRWDVEDQTHFPCSEGSGICDLHQHMVISTHPLDGPKVQKSCTFCSCGSYVISTTSDRFWRVVVGWHWFNHDGRFLMKWSWIFLHFDSYLAPFSGLRTVLSSEFIILSVYSSLLGSPVVLLAI